MISNIAATSSEHIEMILQKPDLVGRLKAAVAQDGIEKEGL